MAEQKQVSPTNVARLSLTGVVMGLVTSLAGIPPSIETVVWIAFYVAWIVLVVRYRIERPFLTVLLGSIATGVLAGAIQVLLFWQYRANNPWYADELQGKGRTAFLMSFVGQGVIAGAIFGLIAGALASRIRAILDARARRP